MPKRKPMEPPNPGGTAAPPLPAKAAKRDTCPRCGATDHQSSKSPKCPHHCVGIAEANRITLTTENTKAGSTTIKEPLATLCACTPTFVAVHDSLALDYMPVAIAMAL